MTPARDQELTELCSIHKLSAGREALDLATALADRSEDPLIVALAKAEETHRARNLGLQQRAVVAGAELLAAVERLGDLGSLVGSDDERLVTGRVLLEMGMSKACCAALDVPEVSLAAIDALIDAYTRVLGELGYRDLAAVRLRARRHFVSGDDARVAAIVEGLVPHVNFTNGHRERFGCPGCVLASFAWYLGPEADPALLDELLAPVFEGHRDFPNEAPEVRRWLHTGVDTYCANAQSCHLFYGRAHLWRGHLEVAEEHTPQIRHFDLDDSFLLPTIYFLELAMASGDGDRIRARVDLLRPRVEPHEDVDEAMVAALRIAQALALLGDDDRDGEQAGLWRFAERCAERLDARLERPRHAARVARERAEGAPFLAALARRAR
ncbi:MAG: hypothetical protein R3A79_11360 [Nannocystaceae bacterium]